MRAGTAAFGLLRAAVALAGVLAVVPAVQAQDIRIAAPTTGAVATQPDMTDETQPLAPLTPEESAKLGNALLFDPVTVAANTPVRSLKLPTLSKPRKLSVDGGYNPDGSAKVVVKKPLTVLDWNADIGADLNTAAPPTTTYTPDRPLPGTADSAGSGSVWASLGVGSNTSFEARVSPAPDQNKIGAGLKQSIPLGDNFSVTVQDKYSVTETYATPLPAPTTVSGLPLMAAPTEPTTQAPPQIFGNDRSVKLNIKPTGTTLGAGFTTASNDPVTHNTLSADQRIYGPLHVTTSVTDVGEATSSKSITAGFKLNW
jgi:hypothetical protein